MGLSLQAIAEPSALGIRDTFIFLDEPYKVGSDLHSCIEYRNFLW